MAFAFLGEHGRAVHDDVENAEAAHTDLRLHAGRAVDLGGEAPGLAAEIGSDEAALDFDLHGNLLAARPPASAG